MGKRWTPRGYNGDAAHTPFTPHSRAPHRATRHHQHLKNRGAQPQDLFRPSRWLTRPPSLARPSPTCCRRCSAPHPLCRPSPEGGLPKRSRGLGRAANGLSTHTPMGAPPVPARRPTTLIDVRAAECLPPARRHCRRWRLPRVVIARCFTPRSHGWRFPTRALCALVRYRRRY